jgi:hypothetical protein
VLDEVEERRLRPVEVVQDDHQRAVAGERLEQLTDRTSSSPRSARSWRRVPRPGNPVGNQLSVVLTLDERGEVGRSGGCELAHNVNEREVGDALAVRRAAADNDPRPGPDLVKRLADQP